MKKIQPVKLLSVIVPAYKEERVIVPRIKGLRRVLETLRCEYEILVIIDGQLDTSFEKLKKAHIQNVRVFTYPENQGKWFAIRLGMKYAKGDYVMFIDGGNEIDPSGMAMLLEHMKWYDADIVVGSKRHSASIVNYTGPRAFFSYGYYYLVKILLGIRVRDTQAGIKLMRRTVMERVLPRLMEKRFSGDLELLVVAQLLGFNRIYEAPIKLNFDLAGISSAASIRSIWNMFIETLAIFYRARIVHFYDKPHKSFREPSGLISIPKIST